MRRDAPAVAPRALAGLRSALICAAATSRQLAWMLIPALVATWVCLLADDPLAATITGAQRHQLDASGLWLHLPCLLLSVTAVGAALDAWPLFCHGRPGATVLHHLRPPWVDGCAPALVGTLLALAATLAAAATAFTGLRVAQDRPIDGVREHVPLQVVEARPILDRSQRRLTLRGAAGRPLIGIRLHPLAFAHDVYRSEPMRVRLAAGGQPLHPRARSIRGRESVLLSFAPRTLDHIELHADPDPGDLEVVLLFPPGSVEGIGAVERSPLVNAILAAWSYLLPAALALALVALGRRQLAQPVALTAGTACLLLFLLTEWLPGSLAVAHHAARRWLLSEISLAMGALSLCMVGLLMTAAAFTGGRRP